MIWRFKPSAPRSARRTLRTIPGVDPPLHSSRVRPQGERGRLLALALSALFSGVIATLVYEAPSRLSFDSGHGQALYPRLLFEMRALVCGSRRAGVGARSEVGARV